MAKIEKPCATPLSLGYNENAEVVIFQALTFLPSRNERVGSGHYRAPLSLVLGLWRPQQSPRPTAARGFLRYGVDHSLIVCLNGLTTYPPPFLSSTPLNSTPPRTNSRPQHPVNSPWILTKLVPLAQSDTSWHPVVSHVILRSSFPGKQANTRPLLTGELWPLLPLFALLAPVRDTNTCAGPVRSDSASMPIGNTTSAASLRRIQA